jgi:L-lysine 2,3-aminomutase
MNKNANSRKNNNNNSTSYSKKNMSDLKDKKKAPKRRKVAHGKQTNRTLFIVKLTHLSMLACVYCRRSHMTCDDGKLFNVQY